MSSVDTKQCTADGCVKTIPNTIAGRTQAWRDGWYIAKYNGSAWCPDDLPDWVIAYLGKRDDNGV